MSKFIASQKFFDINVANRNNDTALFSAILMNNKEIMDFLIAKEANVSHKGGEGLTPLYLATIKGNSETILALLSLGCDVNHSTKSRGSMLENAIVEGRFDVAKLLLENSEVDTSVSQKEGKTLLHILAAKPATAPNQTSSTLELCQLLLQKGASATAQDAYGTQPLGTFCQRQTNITY